ncbi:GNAT family N-acetyltransferase [Clostridium sp. D33t1_170424_F3]|uniref:GNAT family N-acetyltransferase n=1 Tax=Clostridium sp. D33t1_170424_F3 TaxID=2787099 RepID=UPI0018AA5FEC|nr:GNAT family N-acetyltransferase [Clostridium sp. D33t1_170424_F3]MDC0700706.1 GNAT family N-acetyltransferase [Blautia wexlerae]
MEFELRAWKPGDADSVARYANNPRIAANLRDAFPYPYTHEDAEAYVESCVNEDSARQLTRAIVINGEAAGSVGVFLGTDVYRRSAELGYWLAEPFWKKGIMSAAVWQICEEAFVRFDIVRIHAEPFAFNRGSRRVLEKAGFALEGTLRKSVYKNGVIQDSCLYALLKEDVQ